MARRRHDPATGAPRLGFLERSLFSFMGPPELGDVHAPVPDLPPRPVDLCPRCGLDRDEHEVVRTPALTYTRCSADGPGGGPDDAPQEKV